eukprot:389319-Pelagomonas_calceolata.AAC.2
MHLFLCLLGQGLMKIRTSEYLWVKDRLNTGWNRGCHNFLPLQLLRVGMGSHPYHLFNSREDRVAGPWGVSLQMILAGEVVDT